ncbi:MAG: pyridoxamine 5'-phosphate oxidase family protein, partial [Myxococcales bacterium]|nr:pyridoxamine 5'-phosphate oxidase family protein [Myxococcales bacterium]
MNTNETSHLLDVVSQFETAMLVTHDLSGMLRARPMSIAEVEKNGTLWFFTAHD